MARAQDVLKRRILVENPSHYAALPGHEMTRYMAAFRYGGEPTFEPGLTVHRNTARLAARDALGANHPVTRRVIGAPMFEQIAQIYLDWRPLSDPRLHLYGEGLDRLIAEVPALDGLPFLPHLVRLERLWLDSLFAADAPVLSADALPPLDAETRLSPHPATRIEAFPYPVVSLWAAHQGEDPERSLQAMEWGPETALISRTSGASHITTVDPAAVPFLAACNKGESLLSAAATIGPDKAMPVFSRLLVLGAFRAPDPHPHNKEFA